MAVAQKATSRGVSETESPNFDLNHCRSSSTSEISAIGVLQMKDASKTRSSKACSGSVSRIAYFCRAATRAGSFLIGMGGIRNLRRPAAFLCDISFGGRSANNVHPFRVHRKALFLLLGHRTIPRGPYCYRNEHRLTFHPL